VNEEVEGVLRHLVKFDVLNYLIICKSLGIIIFDIIAAIVTRPSWSTLTRLALKIQLARIC